MEIQDRDTIIQWDDFIGGTVLRTIVDFTFSTGISNPLVYGDYETYTSIGIGMPAEQAPSVNDWDPNDPHAEFMWRGTWSQQVRHREGAGAMDQVWSVNENMVKTADITQRRRIRENMKMWAFMRTFMPGLTTPVVAGWTGRVLIRLP